MAKISAGILLYRLTNSVPEVLIVHPGGPYWAKKDLGVWSIPKGELYELRYHKTYRNGLKNSSFVPSLAE
jgi:predicted NUDIX family NTP pyrophosphohydrolase